MPQERPSPGQVVLLAGVALALVGGVVLYRHNKGSRPFGMQPDGEPTRALSTGAPQPSGSVATARPAEGSAREAFPAGDVFSERVRILLGLFYTEAPAERPDDRLRAIQAKEFRGLTLVDRLDSFTATPALAIASPRIDDYPPPTKELVSLVTHGLSAAQMLALPRSQAVLALETLAAKGEAVRTLREVSLLAATVAKETGAVICDRHTGECFSEASWRAQRIAGWTDDTPSLDHHVVIRPGPSGDVERAVTLGMAKLGLPDVVIESFPGSLSRDVASLIRLVCQTLFERGRLETQGRLTLDLDALRETDVKKVLHDAARPSAQRKAEIRVVVGKRREGDPDNRLLEISAPEPALRELLSTLFGSSE